VSLLSPQHLCDSVSSATSFLYIEGQTRPEGQSPRGATPQQQAAWVHVVDTPVDALDFFFFSSFFGTALGFELKTSPLLGRSS
jgi:hypothetical protein